MGTACIPSPKESVCSPEYKIIPKYVFFPLIMFSLNQICDAESCRLMVEATLNCPAYPETVTSPCPSLEVSAGTEHIIECTGKFDDVTLHRIVYAVVLKILVQTKATKM
jgi:hypothetical protein